MRVLHISPYLPSVNQNHAGGVCMGKEVEVLYNLSKLHCLTFITNSYEKDILKQVQYKNFYTFEWNFFNKLFAIATHLWIPVIYAARRSKKFLKTIDEIVKSENIEVIHAEYASMGQYFIVKKKNPNLRFNLVLHDVTQQVYIRKLNVENNLIKRFIYKIELLKVRHTESKYVKNADKVFVFNDKDLKLVKDYYGIEAIRINTFFDLENDIKIKRTIDKVNNSICFMGEMSRPENYSAAKRLCKIVNDLNKEKLICKLYIIGNQPPKEIKEEENPNIVVTGFVKNVDEWINKCKIAVFPLETGAGIKIKVLKAMALGLPVITSKIGAEGIDESGMVLVIVKSDEEIKKNVVDLLNNPQEYERKSNATSEYIKKQFSWKLTEEIFRQEYK